MVEPCDGGFLVAAGGSLAGAESGLGLTPDQIRAEATACAERCGGAIQAEPLIRTMVSQGLHADLSSIRQDASGAFAGLAADQSYSAPARTCYRDGYWTLQILPDRAPEAVASQIELLARGLQPDGEAPGGVILTGDAQSERWEVVRRDHDIIKQEHLRPSDWWSDHFDSPLFFIRTIGDHTDATGDRAPLERHWKMIEAIYRRYLWFDRHGTGLPYKPRNDRDWADNVYRHGYVSYDIGLWIGALDRIARPGADIDATLARETAQTAHTARAALDDELLTQAGHCADHGDWHDFREDHLTLDSLTLRRYRATSPARAKAILERATQILETRHNPGQPYGDWGVMCAWPPFARSADTRAKSAFAYRCHNGSDCPI